MTSRALSRTEGRVAARAAATASVGAALIHFAVTPAHWGVWLPSGIFFASIAVFQLIWAFLVWTRPPAVLLAAGVMANTGFAVLWVWSRTAGEPFGPNAGEPEPVQAAGICALLLECYIVMGAAWAWFRGERAALVSGFGSALVLLGANTVVAAAVTAGVASGLQGHNHHHDGSDAAPSGHPAPHSDHHNHSEPAVPLDARVTQPSTAPAPAAPALPLTEPPHDTNGEHPHDE
ncbi:hypothetical protein [Mycolicibacterium stellerae]|uniref:hypothetical protein n=1 Tax=Mycolicibacterium stellerae TaxID=2358193 RepID=UPI000F0BAEC1|nr:hypothetical protein [Mycolicibacterium stellerae]